ncbi:MAG: hypothetical protein Q9222_000457 [Ikaeria aurantiellina]
MDVAIGDFLDKAARIILPEELIASSDEIMYGRLMEQFAFPHGTQEYGYAAPTMRAEEMSPKPLSWGWALAAPLAKYGYGCKSNATKFSFSGLGSAIERICQDRGKTMTVDERRDLARETFRVAFQHLASRTVTALQQLNEVPVSGSDRVTTIVGSGGVASNRFLRRVYVRSRMTRLFLQMLTRRARLRSFLDTRNFTDVHLTFPPPSLCTDNAAMIAWTGTEMYESGFESDLNCAALRKWSIDPDAEDGGILRVKGWKKYRKRESLYN